MAIERGLRRPPQIKDPHATVKQEHTIRKYNENKELVPETFVVWKIDIESIDYRLTDVLLRAVTAVLHAWGNEVGNASENVLREIGKLDSDAPLPEDTKVEIDITTQQQPSQEPINSGNGS